MEMDVRVSAKVASLLIDKGYKPNGRGVCDADYVIANYYRVPYDRKDLPDCLCNDKPPQVCVQETWLDIHDSSYHRFSVSITNEAPQGWVKFQSYELLEDELVEKFDVVVEGLFKAWKAQF